MRKNEKKNPCSQDRNEKFIIGERERERIVTRRRILLKEKRKKKGSFNRRDVMHNIINYKILIYSLLQNYKIQMEPYKPGL